MARKLLLICGIVSSLLFVVMDIVAARQWEGYSLKSQFISELSAIGAPTRSLMVPFGLVYSLLAIAFGLGVWRSARGSRALRVVAGLLIAYGVICLTGPFFPMHPRGEARALTDTMHILLTTLTVILMLIAIAFSAAAFRRLFRVYATTTIVLLLGFGTLAGLDGPRVARDLPTPWAGVTERINIGVFLLWVVVLAVALFSPRRAERQSLLA